MVTDPSHVFKRAVDAVWRMDWRGLRMEAAIVREDACLVQGGGTRDKMNRFEVYFRINRIGNEEDKVKNDSQVSSR